MASLCAGFSNMRADDVDDFIKARMEERHITGLSLAVIQDGKIVKAQGYGFTDKSGRTAVTTETLFQAGSISKPVAAVGALRLVQEGRLSLDADVNTQLRSWKVPENGFTKEKKVTLRRILAHSAGLTIHGFAGYATNAPIPTLVQVLNGVKPPANSSPIWVNVTPESTNRYSGGGYVVMQQLMIDVTGKPFPEYMRDAVLKPLGMTNSTYSQPPPPALAALTAAGYAASGEEIKGRWHVYPEMAAAGLWTTASDLARFAIGVQQAYAGDSDVVLSQAMTRQMLTAQFPQLSKSDGLGLFVLGNGKVIQFFHDGRNAGFDGLMMAYTNGNGAVVLINANDNNGAIRDIVRFIAKQYGWRASEAESLWLKERGLQPASG